MSIRRRIFRQISSEISYFNSRKWDGRASCGLFAALGCSVFTKPLFVSELGNDFPPDVLFKLRQRVDMSGVATAQVRADEWEARYRDDLDGIDVEMYREHQSKPRLVIPAEAQDSTHVFIAGMNPIFQLAALSQLSGPSLVMLDTNINDLRARRDLFVQAVKQADIICLNQEESLMLTQQNDVYAALSTLLTFGPKVAIIKRGSAGALLATRELFFEIPALNPRPIDTTGAGDSFGGAFLGYLALTHDHDLSDTRSLTNALIAAAATASFTIEAFGPERLQELTLRDVLARIAATKAASLLKQKFRASVLT